MHINLTISKPLQMVVQKSAMETNITKSKVALSISNTYTAVTVGALHMRQRILTKGTTTLQTSIRQEDTSCQLFVD